MPVTRAKPLAGEAFYVKSFKSGIMKTYYLLLALVFTGMTGCHSQETKQEKKISDKKNPREEIVVNKKYDENGNLIALDSVYTYYYSNIEGDSAGMDSILDNFNLYFNHHFSGLSGENFFDTDSTDMSRFFSNDFFEHSFIHQDRQLLRMMREMDSIKNEYFKMHSERNKEQLRL
jgi:hypothetical protein